MKNIQNTLSAGITTITVLLLFQYAGAQVHPDSIRNRSLDDVVITAQYSPQQESNAVYDIDILSRKYLERKGANNLRELLQNEAGLDLTQKSVFGSSIEIRGISKENIKIMVDGVPVIGRLNGVIDLGQISLSNIERVEIIKGPVSVFYGTDAIGGVINLITKKDFEGRYLGSVSAYYESIGAMDLDLFNSYHFGKNTVTLDGSYYQLNGLSTTGAPRSKNWEGKQQVSGNLQFSRNIKTLSLRYAFGIFNEELASLGDTVRTSSGAKKITDAQYFTRRINNSLSLRGPLAQGHFLDVTLAYLDYKRFHDTYAVDPASGASELSSTDTRDINQERFNHGNLRCQIGSNSRKKLNYAFGTDVNYETVEGERILDLKKGMLTTAFFGSLNYRVWQPLEIQPGIRYSYNNVFGPVISPAFSAKMGLGKNHTLRFSYARGFRAPNIKELYLDFRVQAGPVTYIISGNEHLNAEKSHSFELGYHHNLANSHLKIEPVLFYNEIRGLIALTEQVNNARNYFNIDRYKSKGGGLFLIWTPLEEFQCKTGGTLIGRYNKLSEQFDTKDFTYTPEAMASIGYEIPTVGIRADAAYKYVGQTKGFYIASGTEIVETERDDFSILDLNISKSFSRIGLDLFAGVKNVFNVQNIQTLHTAGAAHSSEMQLWGRSFFIKCKYQFLSNGNRKLE